MPQGIKLATASAVALAAYEYLCVRKLRKRCNANKIAALLMTDAYATANKQLEYTVHLLNEHNVELTEFDYIALPSVVKKK